MAKPTSPKGFKASDFVTPTSTPQVSIDNVGSTPVIANKPKPTITANKANYTNKATPVTPNIANNLSYDASCATATCTTLKESYNSCIEHGLEDLLLGSKMRHDFSTFYTLQRKLMSGSYGTVYVGVHNLSGLEYAIKVVDRCKLSPSDDEAQLREVSILKYLASSPPNLNRNESNESIGTPKTPQSAESNPSNRILSRNQRNSSHSSNSSNQGDQNTEDNGIINLIDFYQSPQTYHIVMELARGGDVFDRLARRRVYTEKDARDLAKRMLESISFLHSRGIAHRDIKPENLLLMDEQDNTQLKLADFGFARHFSLQYPSDSMKTKCGTPAFVPPELVAGYPYGPKCDVWSAGCTLFMLLSGRAPFRVDGLGGKNGMYYKIRAGDYVFYDDYWSHISMSARKLVLSMMQVDPKLRVSAEEALQSEWIMTEETILRRSSLEKSLREIISFHARRKLKGAISAVMYAAGGKFWNIETTSIWRECLYDSETAVMGGIEDDSGDVMMVDASGVEVVEHHKHPTFDDLYVLDCELRSGKHATVWEGTGKETGKSYAIKVVGRSNLTQAEDGAVLNEVAILKSLRHKHIVPLLDFFEDPENFYLIMQKCDGGDVLDRIANITKYSEKDARGLSKGLLSAVEFMHGRGIAHRDLKPQNLLLENDADNTSVKICDFGYAKRVHMPQSLTTLCGSPHYVAPELLKNYPYDESADMWSVGVIIYFLLVGYLPFYHKDQKMLFQYIRLGKFCYEAKYWANISEEARSLINHLLEVDPNKRYSATQALQSDWIMTVDDAALEGRDLGETKSGISKERRRLKSIARAVQWGKRNKQSSLSDD